MKHIYSDAFQIVYEQLGKFFKEKRLELKKSQNLSANEYGIPNSLISRIEKGKTEPKLSTIITLCIIYKVTICELLAVILPCVPKIIAIVEE